MMCKCHIDPQKYCILCIMCFYRYYAAPYAMGNRLMAQPGMSPYISTYQVLLFFTSLNFTVTLCWCECFWLAPAFLLTSAFVSPGTESCMDATSALHHATPSKAKLFSLFFLSSLHFSIYSTGNDSEPMLLTHKSERRVCVCVYTIFPVVALLWAEFICYLVLDFSLFLCNC